MRVADRRSLLEKLVAVSSATVCYAFVRLSFASAKDGRTNVRIIGTEHAETARPDDLGFHKVSMPSASPIGDHFVKSWSQFLLRQLPYAFVRLSFVSAKRRPDDRITDRAHADGAAR